MSSYPPSQPQVPPQTSPNVFGSQAPNAPQEESAGKQLMVEVASLNSSLQDLARNHPELAETIDGMLQLLKRGVIQSISQMQTQASEGGTPAY